MKLIIATKFDITPDLQLLIRRFARPYRNLSTVHPLRNLKIMSNFSCLSGLLLVALSILDFFSIRKNKPIFNCYGFDVIESFKSTLNDYCLAEYNRPLPDVQSIYLLGYSLIYLLSGLVCTPKRLELYFTKQNAKLIHSIVHLLVAMVQVAIVLATQGLEFADYVFVKDREKQLFPTEFFCNVKFSSITSVWGHCSIRSNQVLQQSFAVVYCWVLFCVIWQFSALCLQFFIWRRTKYSKQERK